jgi:hypothetical protein
MDLSEPADSTHKCNAYAWTDYGLLTVGFCGRQIAEAFSGTIVEDVLDFVELGLGEAGKGGLFRKEVTDQAV